MCSVEKWACNALEKLGIHDPGVIVRYLQPLEDTAEVEEYLVSFLDVSQESHRKFIEEFLKKKEGAKSNVDSRFYRKPELEEDLVPMKVTDKKKQKGVKESNGTNVSKTSKDVYNNSGTATPPSSSSSLSSSSSGKRKTKFVSLYSDEGQNRDVVLLSGRHKCDCEASKHKLINNCLKCGRIVCEQEGSGPCQFCGNLVVSKEERELLNKGTRKSEALQKKLLSEKKVMVAKAKAEKAQNKEEALLKAVEHKNRLLEFDRTSEKRTKVYDDENDYFSTNSRWISHDDKMKLIQREEELRKKRFERRNQKITIDLFGRKIVAEEETAGVYDPDDPFVKEILEGKSSDIFSAPDRLESGPKVEVSRPQYTDTGITDNITKTSNKFSGMNIRLRVQDRELQEMTDEGVCLSMHQPWASLLVAGIKIHEGRSWYSAHRGRLWIAAAAKVPTPEEIKQLEHQYQVLHKSNKKNLGFPPHYPTSCLLGCVDVVDVLPQEAYRDRYPDGESDSPYVFVCENGQEMILKFPIKGQHKIYKLDPKIHQAAKKSIRSREE
ncbi:hypothetical protein Pmani_037782 [Petrolisthes manimaculis]|uniref:ASCH domain-containing protein n=1 Tax=Petrolisthes manimaculis TaxID=1843537 RepID=A0AAE1NFR3_9EUCA|nr:hypothetical protein Pmani_037782 [Petrolisthes manimaculis]